MQMSGNTILITGGGSGLGAAYAEQFAGLGNTVIVAGRRRAELEKVAAGRANVHAMTLDISNAAEIGAFSKELIHAYPALNVLINNAGMMRTEDITQSRELTDAEETITTNLLGPMRLINSLVEHLKTQRNAAILNVSSGLGFVPLVAAPTYSATKAAIHSYTVSLRERLKGSVEVIEIVPPGVQTDLTPGQSTREGYMPLREFIEESMAILESGGQPEVLVKRVRLLRDAEREGRFEAALRQLNS